MTRWVASIAPLTKGMPNSRATIAACEKGPRTSVIAALAMLNRGVQTGVVAWAARLPGSFAHRAPPCRASPEVHQRQMRASSADRPATPGQIRGDESRRSETFLTAADGSRLATTSLMSVARACRTPDSRPALGSTPWRSRSWPWEPPDNHPNNGTRPVSG